MYPYIGDVGGVYRKFGQGCSKCHVVSWFLKAGKPETDSVLANTLLWPMRVDLLNRMSKITQCNE